MIEEIKALILYNDIHNALEVYKQGNPYNTVSTIRFNLQYNEEYTNSDNLTFKEALLIHATSLLIHATSIIRYQKTIMSKESYKESIEKYKKGVEKEKAKNYHIPRGNIYFYNNLDPENKSIIKEYFNYFYNSFDEGIELDIYLMESLRKIRDYLKKAKEVLGDEVLNKISNPKLFALGIYSKEDYNIILNFNENINKKYNFTEKFDFNAENLYQKFNVPYFHDTGYKIIVKNNSVEFFDKSYAKMTFINATILNHDKLKEYFDTWKEGYVEYLFKYKDGTYLGIYDFLELPEPVIIKFDNLIVEYLYSQDINSILLKNVDDSK